MRHGKAVRAALVGAVLAAAAVGAQERDRARQLEDRIRRIFQAREYDAPRFGPARWLADGASYTVLERAGGGAADIVRYDAATAARTVLVAAARLTPPGAEKPLDIDDYAWSADARRLLIFTNTRRVWRQNTRGDYWVLDLTSGALQKLGGEADPATLMFAKFSPDGERVAYVRQNDIYVERLADRSIVQLTKDGSETTINGTSDWVYEEELDVRDGFRWNPDGRRIAYWQFDTTRVGIFTLINNTDTLYPQLTRIPYPKVGTTNSAVRIGVVDAAGGATRWMQTPGDPRDTYLARLEWIPSIRRPALSGPAIAGAESPGLRTDQDQLAIQQLNRLQNRNDLLIADPDTGTVSRLFRDESKTWVDVVDDLQWVDDGRACLWLSERDGWRHVYRVTRSGGDATPITKFDGDVVAILGLDEKDGWLYFSASPQNATQRYLYRSRLDGREAPVRVTPAEQPGTHTYTIAPGARLAFHTYSRFDRVPSMEVVDLPAHKALRSLTDPSALVKKVQALLRPPAEFLTVDIGGGVTLDAWMIKPPSLDPSKKYPVVVYVYGEPAGQTVLDRWGSAQMLFHRALAEAGYVVVSVDNRGTPAPKGAAWRKVVYGSVGDLSSKEHAAAMRALIKRYAFMDATRIGIWGWSGGGTNTLNALFRFPDLYKVGVSVAPVPDQQLYDTIYQERYMGLPKENTDGYRRGSAINFAEGLGGRLLLIHGTGDDNVHYQGTERLINTLVVLGKPFDVMVYPNRSHGIAEGPGTLSHVYQRIGRYFLENLR